MTFETNDSTWQRATDLDARIKKLESVCQAVVDNTSAQFVLEAYEYVAALQAFITDTEANYNITLVENALEEQYAVANLTSYRSSYNAIKNTKLGDLVTKVENNISALQTAWTINTTTKKGEFGDLTTAQRNSILTDINAILAEYPA